MSYARNRRAQRYLRRTRSTWNGQLGGFDIHIRQVLADGGVAAETMDPMEHRPAAMQTRTILHHNRKATVLANKLDAALAHQRTLNKRTRRNKRHG
ncbi:MAG TPA: hypothetical protein VFD36_29420 [Kofleriaceae bacterium]|nr:hypothetical protein [Kofleriaceae bacterium]